MKNSTKHKIPDPDTQDAWRSTLIEYINQRRDETSMKQAIRQVANLSGVKLTYRELEMFLNGMNLSELRASKGNSLNFRSLLLPVLFIALSIAIVAGVVPTYRYFKYEKLTNKAQKSLKEFDPEAGISYLKEAQGIKPLNISDQSTLNALTNLQDIKLKTQALFQENEFDSAIDVLKKASDRLPVEYLNSRLEEAESLKKEHFEKLKEEQKKNNIQKLKNEILSIDAKTKIPDFFYSDLYVSSPSSFLVPSDTSFILTDDPQTTAEVGSNVILVDLMRQPQSKDELEPAGSGIGTNAFGVSRVYKKICHNVVNVKITNFDDYVAKFGERVKIIHKNDSIISSDKPPKLRFIFVCKKAPSSPFPELKIFLEEEATLSSPEEITQKLYQYDFIVDAMILFNTETAEIYSVYKMDGAKK